MPRYSLRARGPPSGAEPGPAATAGLHLSTIPVGFNPLRLRDSAASAPFGFESRYSGTGISNGVYFFIIPYYL